MICSAGDCTSPTVAKELCSKHYKRVYRHGSLAGSGFCYGSRSDHDLYESWLWQRRMPTGRVPEWDDFWAFVKAAGDRPTKMHRPKRYDLTKPWGPNNFFWYERIPSADSRKEYMRNWRARNPLRAKNHDLKGMYGIDLEEYTRMYDSQSGECAICREHGEAFTLGCGRSTTLAVDHCHKTGRVRGLLCAKCNKGLGCLGDSVETLKVAIEYLSQSK